MHKFVSIVLSNIKMYGFCAALVTPQRSLLLGLATGWLCAGVVGGLQGRVCGQRAAGMCVRSVGCRDVHVWSAGLQGHPHVVGGEQGSPPEAAWDSLVLRYLVSRLLLPNLGEKGCLMHPVGTGWPETVCPQHSRQGKDKPTVTGSRSGSGGSVFPQ